MVVELRSAGGVAASVWRVDVLTGSLIPITDAS
jgi:hypothetical protein